MSKRKPAIASKHTHSPRIAAKAQRASQAIARSPKDSVSRSVGAGSTEPSPEPHNNLEQDVVLAEHGAPLIKNPEVTVQNDPKQMMEDASKTGVDFLSSASANVRAYQAKLLEVAQANMQLVFEFTQTLASIRSPAEFPRIVAEFTSKRIALFRKHSTELTELGTRRWSS
jgi:phasin protein